MNNTYPNGIQPNIIWRLTSSLFTIQKAMGYLIKWQETKNLKDWTQHILKQVGIAFEYATIVEEQLSKNYLIADRLLEFYHVLYKYNADEEETIKIRQTIRIYKTMYKATFKFWIMEIKKLNYTTEYLEQNANKILNETDPYFDPVIKHFKTLVRSIQA